MSQDGGMVSRCRIGVAAIMLAPLCSFDDYARGGRAGHHRDVSGQHIRHPADRIRVRRLLGAAARHDADLENRLAVRRRRRLHRRGEPQLQPAQSHRSWVTAVSLQGWRIIPIYVGHQAPCTARPNAIEFTTTTAALLGTADAADAVLQAQALGMLPGSAIYGDMEHYFGE